MAQHFVLDHNFPWYASRIEWPSGIAVSRLADVNADLVAGREDWEILLSLGSRGDVDGFITNDAAMVRLESAMVALHATRLVLVVIRGATEKEKSLNTFYSGGYGGYGWRGWGAGGMGTATTTTSEYTVGTLVVDIFDAKSKQLLFRGTAQDELSDKPEKNQKKLAKASDKMFKDFPPGSKKK